MRRPLIVLPALVGLLAAAGCEDGPNDPFQAAPAGAGSIWIGNNSPDAAVVATQDGGQGFEASYPTSNAAANCSTDTKRVRWAWMLIQPIAPPRQYAGIDLAGDDLWDGLKIEDAELPPSGDPNAAGGGLCQSTAAGSGSCPSGFGNCNYGFWGNNQEVSFSWNTATHLIDQMVLQLGYVGTFTTSDYPDHTGTLYHYTIKVGDVLRRAPKGTTGAGDPFLLDWDNPNWTATPGPVDTPITDVYNAVMATFALTAGVPFETTACKDDTDCKTPGFTCQCTHASGTSTACAATSTTGQCGDPSCGADAGCLEYNSGGGWIFGIRPLVIYVSGNSGLPQPAISTPTNIYNFFAKTLPYSNLPQEITLDVNGPIATGTPNGVPVGTTDTCTQQIGQTFKNFRTTCVQVAGDASNPKGADVVNLNKITHGLTHDQEHYTANVAGVNQNFTDVAVASSTTAVILDIDTPQDNDVAEDFFFDVRAKGQVRNDYDGPPPTGHLDLHGSSLVIIEWARLLLEDAAKIQGTAPIALGDPRCTGFDASGQPNYKSHPGIGCTGLEGIIIPHTASVSWAGDPKLPPHSADPYASNYDTSNAYTKSLLKPGDLLGSVCIDPVGQTDCQTGFSLFSNAFNNVIRVMGNGDVNALPPEMRDRRYYFRWFGVAMVKYLKAYGNYVNPANKNNIPNGTVGSGLAPSDLAAQDFDYESLFFDYTISPGAGGAQTYDKFEYIDRDFITTGTGPDNTVPWDFEYGIDLLGGNQRYMNWYRRMDREEIAMFSATLEDKTKTPGSQGDMNITNMFGSPVLEGMFGYWPTPACATGQGGDPSGSSYECGSNPPLDPNSSAPPCQTGGTCANPNQVCAEAPSWENGTVAFCGDQCNFGTYPNSGCKLANQTCVQGACLDMMMDDNTPGSKFSLPILARYPGVWGTSVFHRGHSPITLPAAGKQPGLGVAQFHIPNFAAGPYVNSPIVVPSTGCPTGYSLSTNKAWCQANVVGTPGTTGLTGAEFTAPVPWQEVQPGVGFSIQLDGQRTQWVTSGQMDFTGVLETYLVDYIPYVDPGKSSCVASGVVNDAGVLDNSAACNAGYTCDPQSHNCVTDDDTIQVLAIEGADFLGEVFLCQDPSSGDLLHVRMYDSALSILDWFARHPNAQSSCGALVIRSPYDTAVDAIVSNSAGVNLNISTGQGQGRVTDVVVFDPTLVQSL